VLFAPGVRKPVEIKALVEAVDPKPFNLLVVNDIGMSVADIAEFGVRRISVGGALALAGWTGFVKAAKTLQANGSFAGLADLTPYPEINDFLAADFRARQERES
jgi:2-methylisocitrate lyase-like PEP mutase family enzyme